MNNTPKKQIIYSYIFIVMICILLTMNSDNKLLKFIDAYTIIGLCITAFSVFYNLYLKGDFDIFRYYSRKAANVVKKDSYTQEFSEFKQEYCNVDGSKKNTPLYLGVFMILTAAIMSYLYMNM